VLLYFAQAAFIPIALALLCALVLSAPVEALHRRRIPRMLSAAVILVTTLMILTWAAGLLREPVQHWVASAPQTTRAIRARITPLAQFLGRIETLRQDAGSIGQIPQRAPPAAAPVVARDSAPMLLFRVTRGIVIGALTTVILTLFLLAGGPPMLARMTAALVDDLNASHVHNLIEKVRAGVGKFYATTAMINFGLGLATAAAMALWGMPTPYLWGGLAGALNFFPYIGSATTLLAVTLVAVVSFDSLGQILGVAGSYLALATLEGQVVQPMLVGRRLELNPLVVFLALWFGGLFWGVAGIILATPSLIALKIIAENSSGGKALLEFLGPADRSPARDQKLRSIARRLS
jgi:predicted PurR-regulated permease PerM